MDTTISIEETKGPTDHLVEMIEESMELMKAYITNDGNCEIIVDGQGVSQHVHGPPPTHDDFLQTREATSGSHTSYFRQLGALVPHHMSKKEFGRLFGQYTKLSYECEKIHRREER